MISSSNKNSLYFQICSLYEYAFPYVSSTQSQVNSKLPAHLSNYLEFFSKLQAQNIDDYISVEIFPSNDVPGFEPNHTIGAELDHVVPINLVDFLS